MRNNPRNVNPTQVPLQDALKRRYATKKFDPARHIPQETWEVLEQSLVLTPSSFGLQPWQFLIVENPVVREQLRAASWGQSQVTDASHLVVFTARTSMEEADVDQWIGRISEVQSTPLETLAPLGSVIKGFIQPMSPEARQAWNTRQVYIALGQFMAAAAVLGLDTCPLEGIDPAGYDRVLGLENSGFATAVGCAVGYRAEDDRYANLPKVRYPHERLIRRIQ